MKGVYILANSPITQIKMITVPWDSTYSDVVKFTNTTNQYNYMNSRTGSAMFSNAQYVRKNETYRMPYSFDECFNFNYVMYNNGEGKGWEYAFIKEHIFVSMESTDIILEYDIYQNNLFKMNVHQCFVEREIVADDTIGKHILPENIELGEFTSINLTQNNVTSLGIAIYVTEVLDTLGFSGFLDPKIMGGIPVPLYCYRSHESFSGPEIPNIIKMLCDTYSNAGKEDAIVAIFTIPLGSGNNWDMFYSDLWNARITTINLANKSLTITPKNNKLHTFPYTSMILSSNSKSVNLKYEKFTSGYKAQIVAGFGPNSTVACIPNNYDNLGTDVSKMVTINGFPLIGWTTDYYNNWIAQNKSAHENAWINTGIGVAASAGSVLAGVALAPVTAGTSLALAGAGIAGAAGIAKTASDISAQKQQADIMPDSMNGSEGAGNILAVSGKLGFRSYCRTLTAESASKIDSYFSAFGYQINQVKMPDMTSRPQWNFVKTVGAKISNVPEEDRHALQNVFDNGIRFWHNPANIYNFSLTNK